MTGLEPIAEELFRVRRRALRLETRSVYATDDEAEPLACFLAGRPVPLDWFKPWITLIGERTTAGARFARVRFHPPELTDYLRFELWTCGYNAAAGEDIRYLPDDVAREIGLPTYDYWILDDRLALMYFTEDGRPLGVQMVTDPAIIESHCRWFEAAARRGTPYRAFVATHPVTAVAEEQGNEWPSPMPR